MTLRKRRSLHVPGVTHGTAPIPMGSRVGNIIFSSGIFGKDPKVDALPETVEEQVRFAFLNMEAVLAEGGATTDDVVRMTIHVKDDSARGAVNSEWLRCFPDPDDRPARHMVVTDLRAGMLVQLEVIAVID